MAVVLVLVLVLCSSATSMASLDSTVRSEEDLPEDENIMIVVDELSTMDGAGWM